jgi:outer membrane receptor protein involved in Fe transport
MKLKFYPTAIFLFFLFFRVSAQQDSTTLLLPQELGQDDIYEPLANFNSKVQIVAGSRFPIAATDLPFSTYIISKEEIRQNSYETLVDALKMAPGIRVSQPGSALEGETFLMRGLLGNAYTKILINDVPVKPAFVAGMPIGAQLPVREAERIEVIYGAGAALYGADASAGVINIITRQSEKPVFMQADLSVGGGLYSSVNVMFGGKLGRDRHILKYFFYGSNVLQERRNIFYDTGYNYNPMNYPLLNTGDIISYDSLPNYAGTPSTPLLTNTPHLSRKFGMTLKFRGITLSAETMYRRDHSSLGLNPVAVSYRNPLTYTGERILRVNANFFKQKENKNHKTDLTYLSYRLDDRSSILYVQNGLTNELKNAAIANALRRDPNDPGLPGENFFTVYDRYQNGLRFLQGWSEEFRIEHVRNYRLFKKMTLTAGANARVSGGYPMTGLLSRPPAETGDFVGVTLEGFDFDSLTYPVKPEARGLAEGNLFGQLFYNGKKFNLAAGIDYAGYAAGTDTLLVTSFSKWLPRLAGIWKITESLNLRTSWGKAFRIPNEFYMANSYVIGSEKMPFVGRRFTSLEVENTTSWESGIRITPKGDRASFDLTWFVNETSDLISYGRFATFSPDSTEYMSVLGYRNNRNSTIRFTGGQVSLAYKFTANNRNWLEGQYNFSWTKAKLNVPDGGENIPLPKFDGRIHQLRVIVRALRKTTLIVDYLRLNGLARTAGPEPQTKFATVDLVFRYAFNDRFDVYIKWINMLDRQYSGIPATRTPDDLLYNPQTGSFFRLGMNYYLE